ncbi:MAG: NAD-binding protein [Desulfocapsaceae bacterium]|nr:NAD-binding protein [Desulfocapsaceae bacterium]
MRIVLSGANSTTVKAAAQFIKQGHEVILIELDKERIDELSENLDCSFLHGDAGKPSILEQTAPEECDFLFCLTDSDQVNIITSLLGRSMGFNKVITCIHDEDLLPLCDELDLTHTIVPDRTMSQYLDNLVRGLDEIELSALLKNDARFFSFIVDKEDAGKVSELELPDKSKLIYYYRDEDFFFADDDTTLRQGDEVVILTSSEYLSDLQERWHPKETDDKD